MSFEKPDPFDPPISPFDDDFLEDDDDDLD
jgi:hypothetical protein